jgi:transcriptional regulator with XRE-family HTH domain
VTRLALPAPVVGLVGSAGLVEDVAAWAVVARLASQEAGGSNHFGIAGRWPVDGGFKCGGRGARIVTNETRLRPVEVGRELGQCDVAGVVDMPVDELREPRVADSRAISDSLPVTFTGQESFPDADIERFGFHTARLAKSCYDRKHQFANGANHTSSMTKRPINEVLAGNLKRLMPARGFKSQQALAKASKLSQRTMSNYLNPQNRSSGVKGKEPSAKLTEVAQLATALRVDVWELLVDEAKLLTVPESIAEALMLERFRRLEGDLEAQQHLLDEADRLLRERLTPAQGQKPSADTLALRISREHIERAREGNAGATPHKSPPVEAAAAPTAAPKAPKRTRRAGTPHRP